MLVSSIKWYSGMLVVLGGLSLLVYGKIIEEITLPLLIGVLLVVGWALTNIPRWLGTVAAQAANAFDSARNKPTLPTIAPLPKVDGTNNDKLNM